ncbi:MAG: phosphoribosyltransferase domain-containing protein [Thiohalocapsa sp.]|nr:phosphoribosyltransferase domain-containing protein [Thiohalocapsa sp.]
MATRQELLPLERLLGFAARANPKRPFLFVSRVLGRHVPVRPSEMRASYRMLAEPLHHLPGPIWVMGMAETATGLGLGVADTIASEAGRDDVFAQHTTRFNGDEPPLLVFKESHSHAPVHLVRQPAPALRGALGGARSLVIVDDEVSTGRSVSALVRGLLARMPNVENVAFANLVDWLDSEQRALIGGELADCVGSRALDVIWHSLVEGAFTFNDDGQDDGARELPVNVVPRVAARGVRGDLGRSGLQMPACSRIDLDALNAIGRLPSGAEPVAVIGTGECAFEPFLLAEALEHAGYAVHLQCLSRSPARLGGAIAATLDCRDPYSEGVGYYLHNPPPREQFCIAVHEHPLTAPLTDDGRYWLHLLIPDGSSR